MLTKSIITLALLSVGYVQAAPLRYAREYSLVFECPFRGVLTLCFFARG